MMGNLLSYVFDFARHARCKILLKHSSLPIEFKFNMRLFSFFFSSILSSFVASLIFRGDDSNMPFSFLVDFLYFYFFIFCPQFSCFRFLSNKIRAPNSHNDTVKGAFITFRLFFIFSFLYIILLYFLSDFFFFAKNNYSTVVLQ